MTLPTVPAWAAVNQSATSCGTNPNTTSCAAEYGPAAEETDLFDGPTQYGTQTDYGAGKQKPPKGKKKDKDDAFLSSGNWLNSKP
jgi:hypothetical protein